MQRVYSVTTRQNMQAGNKALVPVAARESRTYPEHVTALDAHALQGGVRGDAGAQQRRDARVVPHGQSLGNPDDEVAVDNDGAAVASVGGVALQEQEEDEGERWEENRRKSAL